MLKRKKIMCSLLCAATIMGSTVGLTITAHADPYHSLVSYYGDIAKSIYGDNYYGENFYANDENGLKWRCTKLYDGTISLNGLKTRVENVEIPSTIDGYTVSEIGSMAIFNDRYEREIKEIKSVHIPDTIRKISVGAFNSLVNLEEINIPNNITDLSYHSFDSTKWIKNQQYDENGCLIINGILLDAKISNEKFTVPSNVIAVGEDFLKRTYSETDNEKGYDKIKEIIIPSNVVEVRKYAFSDLENLEKVTFENNLTYVEPYAFSNCKNLTKAELPIRNKITTYAFDNTPILDDILKDMNLVDGISILPEPSKLHNNEELRQIIFNNPDIDRSGLYAVRNYKDPNYIYSNIDTNYTPNNNHNNNTNGNENNSNVSDKRGWCSEGEYRYYYDSNGNKVTGFQTIDSKNYYFYSTGEMAVGVVDLGNSALIYADTSDNSNNGALLTGWKKVNGDWYYFNPISENNNPVGVNKTGWIYDNGCWYYFYSTGQMATGFINLGDNAIYYLDESGTSSVGIMRTGWQLINGYWYYFNTSSDSGVEGMMNFGWQKINGKWYYFYSTGEMAVSTYIDGYYVNYNGEWV